MAAPLPVKDADPVAVVVPVASSPSPDKPVLWVPVGLSKEEGA